MLLSINITAFDDCHNKLFGKGSTLLPQDILANLPKFHTPKMAKEDIYKTFCLAFQSDLVTSLQNILNSHTLRSHLSSDDGDQSDASSTNPNEVLLVVHETSTHCASKNKKKTQRS